MLPQKGVTKTLKSHMDGYKEELRETEHDRSRESENSFKITNCCYCALQLSNGTFILCISKDNAGCVSFL